MAFGEFAATAESLPLSTNDTTAYDQKVRLTTPTVDAGDYRVGYSWTYGSDDRQVEVLVELDDTTELYRMLAEVVDKDLDQRYPASGFARVTLGAGVHTFDIDFRSSDDGRDARIAQARLEFWRVD